MNGYHRKKNFGRSEEGVDNVESRSPSRWDPLTGRRFRRRERERLINDQRLAWHAQRIIAGCDLTQTDYSIAAGRIIHIPQVVRVVAGPPVGIDIHILPGQAPGDFVRHASTIAYHLGVAEVRVVPLHPPLIRLELIELDRTSPKGK